MMKISTEDTMCPSVGVIRCSEDDLMMYENFGKTRLTIAHCFDFPIKALDFDVPRNEGREAIVLLGLGRPWNNEGQYYPARCYVLVINILIRE